MPYACTNSVCMWKPQFRLLHLHAGQRYNARMGARNWLKGPRDPTGMVAPLLGDLKLLYCCFCFISDREVGNGRSSAGDNVPYKWYRVRPFPPVPQRTRRSIPRSIIIRFQSETMKNFLGRSRNVYHSLCNSKLYSQTSSAEMAALYCLIRTL